MLHTINIEKIIPGGLGLGRLDDGMIVLTKYVLPGETVLVRETRKRREYLEAMPVEILDSSPDRVNPPCPYFEKCGGCNFQHISDLAQQRIKNEIIRESLKRARVTFDYGELQPLLPSPQTYHYRFRVRLQVTADGRIGFYQSGTNTLIEISGCLVATDLINTFLRELTDSALCKKIAAGLGEIELLHSPADDRLIAVFHQQRKKNTPGKILKEFAASLDSGTSLFLKKGNTLLPVGERGIPDVLSQHFDKSICGHPFDLSWSPVCFSQVNAEQNHRLIELACRLYSKTGGPRLLDLYCGMGNFSVPLGLSGATVTGIEQNRESIQWARYNAKRAGLTEFSFNTGDVVNELRQLQGQNTLFDVILLDPPRKGLGKAAHLLADLGPQSILYISCDPATLVRDLAVLIEREYNLTTLAPVDMFPQTHHIESVAFLEKN